MFTLRRFGFREVDFSQCVEPGNELGPFDAQTPAIACHHEIN